MREGDAVIKPEQYSVTILLGHVEIDSFFRIENGQMVGYGRATHYDQNGNINKITESPTGLAVIFGDTA
jgi:hypothetical protein